MQITTDVYRAALLIVDHVHSFPNGKELDNDMEKTMLRAIVGSIGQDAAIKIILGKDEEYDCEADWVIEESPQEVKKESSLESHKNFGSW